MLPSSRINLHRASMVAVAAAATRRMNMSCCRGSSLRYSYLYKASFNKNQGETLRCLSTIVMQDAEEKLFSGTRTDMKQNARHSLRALAYSLAGFATMTSCGLVASSSSSSSSSSTTSLTLCQAASANNNTAQQPQQHKQPSLTPATVSKEGDFLSDMETNSQDKLPVYTAEQMAEHDGSSGGRIWMSYGGIVYDVTDFIPNHPGGSEKILMAAGQPMEPFWHIYRQHFASNLPMLLMEHMAIGRLDEADQQAVDEQMARIEEEEGDPYQHEPDRHRSLRVHSDTPMNAETPSHLLTKQWYTPNSLFYIRHHHPVPYLTDEQIEKFRLIIDVSAYKRTKMNDATRSSDKKATLAPDNDGILRLSMEQLKSLPKTEITATLQCSGNRRTGFNAFQRTTGTPWGQGAISTAKFGGVLLKDLLRAAGLDDPIAAQDQQGLNHVQFDALDGMLSSIDIEKACSPYGDVLVAYEMNDVPLPRDHGFPLRVIVPGYAAVRSVKWLSRIAVQKDEATGPWQRGLNYKVLPPNVTDATGQNLEEMPSVMETSIFSGITNLEVVDAPPGVCPGDRVTVQARGWAWAGGGRKIVRVDVTGDQGKSWVPSKLLTGADQRRGRAWAWTFWECEVPGCVVQEDGTVRLASKAVDSSLNTQPENSSPTWNVRGLNNTAWYRAQTRVCSPEHI